MSTRLSLPEVTKVGRAILKELGGRVRLNGVAASSGDSHFVELLVEVRGRDHPPRTSLIAVRRIDRGTFEADLTRRIGQLLHPSGH